MKVKVNLTIDDELLTKAKRYAARKKTSISGLVEDYFKKVAHSGKRKTVLELLDELDDVPLKSGGNLTKQYYEDQAKKYGL